MDAIMHTQIFALCIVVCAMCADYFPLDTGKYWTYLGTSYYEKDFGPPWYYYCKFTLSVTAKLTKADTTYYTVDQEYDSTTDIDGTAIPVMSSSTYEDRDSALAYLKRLDSAGAFDSMRRATLTFVDVRNTVLLVQPIDHVGLSLRSVYHTLSDSTVVGAQDGSDCRIVDSARVLDLSTGDSARVVYFNNTPAPIGGNSVFLSLADGIGCMEVSESYSLAFRFSEYLVDHGSKPVEPARQAIQARRPALAGPQSAFGVKFFDLLGRPVPASLVPQGRGHLGRMLIRKGPDGSALWFGPGDLRP